MKKANFLADSLLASERRHHCFATALHVLIFFLTFITIKLDSHVNLNVDR